MKSHFILYKIVKVVKMHVHTHTPKKRIKQKKIEAIKMKYYIKKETIEWAQKKKNLFCLQNGVEHL